MRYLDNKILSKIGLTLLAKDFSYDGLTIVAASGCFDILHYGHIQYLSEAKSLGHVLVVGVNSDNSVKRLNKSFERPIVPQTARANTLAALEVVDFVYVFDEPTPKEFLEILRPEIYAKGSDYADLYMPERSTVEGNGGVVKLIDYDDLYSTTALINKILLLKKTTPA